MAAKRPKHPSRILNQSWHIAADNGEARGKPGVRGYATEGVSARTHEFIFYPPQHLRAAELFRMRPTVPEYIRRTVGGLMRQVHARNLAERKSS